MAKGKESFKLYIGYTLEYIIIVSALIKILGSFSFITTGDGYNQYYPVMVYCGKYFRELFKGIIHGKMLFKQFDFSIGLGEGIIPALNYYGFGDPFLVLSALFPVKYSAYGYSFVYLVKIYVSGLAFIYYCKNRNCHTNQILIGIPTYIASQFILCHGVMYPTTFMNLMISTPLICAAIDKEIKRNEFSPVICLAVAFQALCGFYTVYMGLLFAGVYAFICILCQSRNFKYIIHKIVRLLGQVLLGIGISGIIFVPALIGYFSGARSADFKIGNISSLFAFDIDMLDQIISSLIIPLGLQEIGLILPFLAVIAIIFAFYKDKIHTDIKIVVFVFSVLYLNMKVASWIAGGFTNSIYYGRWTFSLLFLLSFMIVVGAESLTDLTIKQWCICGSALVGYFILLFVKSVYAGQLNDKNMSVYTLYGGYTCIAIAIILITSKIRKIEWYIFCVLCFHVF